MAISGHLSMKLMWPQLVQPRLPSLQISTCGSFLADASELHVSQWRMNLHRSYIIKIIRCWSNHIEIRIFLWCSMCIYSVCFFGKTWEGSDKRMQSTFPQGPLEGGWFKFPDPAGNEPATYSSTLGRRCKHIKKWNHVPDILQTTDIHK